MFQSRFCFAVVLMLVGTQVLFGQEPVSIHKPELDLEEIERFEQEFVPKCKDEDYLKIIDHCLEGLARKRCLLERTKNGMEEAIQKGGPIGTPEIPGMPIPRFIVPHDDLSPTAFWKAYQTQGLLRAECFKRLERASWNQHLSFMTGTISMSVQAIREADKQGQKYDEFKRRQASQK